MPVIARRMTIITLILTIFAISFSALVAQPGRRGVRVHAGTSAICYHPASESCVAAL